MPESVATPELLSRKPVKSLRRTHPVVFVLGALVAIVLAFFCGTQHTAAGFDYDPRLPGHWAVVPSAYAWWAGKLSTLLIGAGVLSALGCHLLEQSQRGAWRRAALCCVYLGGVLHFARVRVWYAPYDLGLWLHRFWEAPVAQPVLQEGTFVMIVVLLGGYAVMAVTVARPRFHKVSDTYGAAKFGDGSWFDVAGEKPAHGVPVGYLKDSDKLLYESDGAHTFVCAPTGGGKTVGFAIPTALSHRGSAFILDIKGEIHAVTARHRRKDLGQTIRLLDPFGEGEDACNPMDMIVTEPGRDHRAFDDAKMISEMLVIRTGQEKEPFFVNNAQQLITGLILYVAYKEPRTLENRIPDYEEYQRRRTLVAAQGAGSSPLRANDLPFPALREVGVLAERARAYFAASHGEEATGDRGESYPLSDGAPTTMPTGMGAGTDAAPSYSLGDLSAGSWVPGLKTRVYSVPNRARSLIEVRKLLTQSDTALRATLRKMMSFRRTLFEKDSPPWRDRKTQEEAVGIVNRRGAQFADMDERTFSSIVSTARSQTEFLDSPAMARALAHSTFDFAELKQRPSTVYLSIPIERLTNYARFVRLMVATAQARLLSERNRPRYPVLILLDEFARLERLGNIDEGLSAHRSFGLQYLIIVQSVAQLEDVYGKLWRNFISNTTLQVLWAANDDQATNFISTLAGDHTVAYIEESQNLSRQGKGMFSLSYSRGESRTLRETRRRLVQPEEARTLNDKFCFVFFRGEQPMIVRRPNYLCDPIFAGTFDPNPFHEPVRRPGTSAYETYGKDFERTSTRVFRDPVRARWAFLVHCCQEGAESARQQMVESPQVFGSLQGHPVLRRTARRAALERSASCAALGFQYFLAEGERRVRGLLHLPTETSEEELREAFIRTSEALYAKPRAARMHFLSRCSRLTPAHAYNQVVADASLLADLRPDVAGDASECASLSQRFAEAGTAYFRFLGAAGVAPFLEG